MMSKVFDCSFLVIDPPTLHGAADAEINALSKETAHACLLLTPLHRIVRTHNVWLKSHIVLEPYLKLGVFASSLTITASVA